MKKTTTRILKRDITGEDYYILTLGYCFNEPVTPGQFVMIGLAGVHDPFLKRPYSIYRAIKPDETDNTGKIQLLIKAVGRGSRQMMEAPIGSEVEVIGPLGKGFSKKPDTRQAVFVAGGIGVAPFVELAASPMMKGVTMTALIGGRTGVDVQGVEDLQALGVAVRTATDNGSLGRQGLVTALLEEMITEGLGDNVQVYSCGPEPMMKAVGKIAAMHGLDCQLSLEAIMGCGFGVCLGCVVKGADGHYKRVCREGPVVQADALADYGATPHEEENR